MSNIELAPQNPFSAPVVTESQLSTGSRFQLKPAHQMEAITEILAVAVLRNRFRRNYRQQD